jgi:hypothetical protein
MAGAVTKPADSRTSVQVFHVRLLSRIMLDTTLVAQCVRRIPPYPANLFPCGSDPAPVIMMHPDRRKIRSFNHRDKTARCPTQGSVQIKSADLPAGRTPKRAPNPHTVPNPERSLSRYSSRPKPCGGKIIGQSRSMRHFDGRTYEAAVFIQFQAVAVVFICNRRPCRDSADRAGFAGVAS